jgi:hypothetical protein
VGTSAPGAGNHRSMRDPVPLVATMQAATPEAVVDLACSERKPTSSPCADFASIVSKLFLDQVRNL